MKNVRIVLALVVILVVVAVAQGAGAWNTKLNANDAPAAAPAAEGSARLVGTVVGEPEKEITSNPGECSEQDSIATYCPASQQKGLIIQGLTELKTDMPLPEGAVLTRLVEITGEGIGELTEDVTFTFAVPLAEGEKVSYWNGTEWVELIAENGAYLIPAGTPLPIEIIVNTG